MERPFTQFSKAIFIHLGYLRRSNAIWIYNGRYLLHISSHYGLPTVWDLRFSKQWCRRYNFCGKWRRVVGREDPRAGWALHPPQPPLPATADALIMFTLKVTSRQHRRCNIPQAVNSLLLPRKGEIIARNMLSWLKLWTKLLLLHLVGCLYY